MLQLPMHFGIGSGHQISIMVRRRAVFKRKGYLAHGLASLLTGTTDAQDARSLLNLPALRTECLGQSCNIAPVADVHDGNTA